METPLSARVASLDQLKCVASAFSKELRCGDTIGLCGELGAGKTTFVRFLVEELGCTEAVSSPTYILCHEYSVPNGVRVEHWDLYRLSVVPDELLESPEAEVIRIVEWADKFSEVMADCTWQVTLEIESSGEGRRITLVSK